MVRILTSFFVFFIALNVRAEVLFEGYSKVLANGAPIGYIITKYEFDAKSKKFIAITFLKTAGKGMEITESVKATADSKLGPLSYNYTSIVGKEIKTIDAKFTGLKMTAIVKEGKKTVTIRKDLPAKTFLSTFLVYVMLNGDGIKTDYSTGYTAVAEEDAEVYDGIVSVGKEESFQGLKAYKIQNKFKKIPFISYVNDRGEVLATNSITQGVSTELVADPAQATKGFPVSEAILKNLFGEVPAGKQNMLSKNASVTPSAPGKQEGIPQGKDIQIKGEAPATLPGK